jgi:hypothetical protein
LHRNNEGVVKKGILMLRCNGRYLGAKVADVGVGDIDHGLHSDGLAEALAEEDLAFENDEGKRTAHTNTHTKPIQHAPQIEGIHTHTHIHNQHACKKRPELIQHSKHHQ